MLAGTFLARGQRAKGIAELKNMVRRIQKNEWDEDQYFRARALEFLGQSRKASTLFKKAQESCENQIRESKRTGWSFSRAELYFDAALAAKGLRDLRKARKHLRDALRLHPGHHGARWHYAHIKA